MNICKLSTRRGISLTGDSASELIVIGILALGGLGASATARADASYQQTTQITAGTLVDTLKSVPFMRSQLGKLFDPVNTLTLLQGNKLATISASSTQIIDIDKETITHIDSDKKTYSVTTFAQMREAFKNMPQRIAAMQSQAQAAQQQNSTQPRKAPNLQVTFDVSTEDPGTSKLVNGLMATEHIVTLKTHVTNLDAPATDPGRTVTYTFVTDSWTAPEPAQVKQIHEFYERYGKALMKGVDASELMRSVQPAVSNASLGAIFGGKPGMGDAFAEMSKKMAEEQKKRKGSLEVLTVVRMGGEAMVVTPGSGVPPSAASASSSSNNSVGSVATQVATNTGTEIAADQTSRLGMFGSVLGRNVLGAFHRRNSSSSSSNASQASAASSASMASAVLFETTSQKSQFSAETVPAEAFQVPAGYTKVETPALGS